MTEQATRPSREDILLYGEWRYYTMGAAIQGSFEKAQEVHDWLESKDGKQIIVSAEEIFGEMTKLLEAFEGVAAHNDMATHELALQCDQINRLQGAVRSMHLNVLDGQEIQDERLEDMLDLEPGDMEGIAGWSSIGHDDEIRDHFFNEILPRYRAQAEEETPTVTTSPQDGVTKKARAGDSA